MTSGKHVRTEFLDGTLVVSLQSELGSLTDEGREREFDATVAEVADPKVQNVLMDLKSANYFGSKVLEWMVVLWKRVRDDKKGHMAMCHVSSTARDILGAARFDTIWPIYDSREDALESFRAD
jgi:anti-anti-sigma factor